MDELVARFTAWAEARPDVVAAALIGSHARGTPGSASDVDLVLVTVRPQDYASDPAWTTELGPVESIQTEDWGAVTSLRVRYAGGPEVELGLTAPDWAAADPVDPGTERVVLDGFRILLDRDGLLRRLERAVVTRRS